MKKYIFTEYPNSVGESSSGHGSKTVSYTLHMMLADVCCVICALFPLIFQTTASNIVRKVCNDVDRRVENNNFH